MAGHSQFSNIKHRKDAQDRKRAKLFTRCSRLIEVAARSGLPDPEMNSKLRTAIILARKINMPKDRVAQAIAKGSNAATSSNYDEVRYEFRHSSGVCCIVNAMTDNRNRTASDVRHILTKHGCTIVNPGGVLYLFDNVGEIIYKRPALDGKKLDMLMESAIEAGALDIEEDKENIYVYVAPTDFDRVSRALEENFGESDADSKITWRPRERVEIESEAAAKLIAVVEALEDLDDVESVDTNCA